MGALCELHGEINASHRTGTKQMALCQYLSSVLYPKVWYKDNIGGSRARYSHLHTDRIRSSTMPQHSVTVLSYQNIV